MNIKIGEAVDNKTWRFLIPCIKGHGSEFVEIFNTHIFKLAYGVMDKLVEGAPMLEDKRPIFILCDTHVLTKRFWTFIEWIKDQPYYIADYSADSGANPRMHMIVIDTPEKYYNAYDKFCMGLYSEMYSPEELDYLFTDKASKQYKVLSRDRQYSDVFINQLEEEFSMKLSSNEKEHITETAEYEFPYSLNIEEEIFNS